MFIPGLLCEGRAWRKHFHLPCTVKHSSVLATFHPLVARTVSKGNPPHPIEMQTLGGAKPHSVSNLAPPSVSDGGLGDGYPLKDTKNKTGEPISKASLKVMI